VDASLSASPEKLQSGKTLGKRKAKLPIRYDLEFRAELSSDNLVPQQT
jgi:hypothetical protein